MVKEFSKKTKQLYIQLYAVHAVQALNGFRNIVKLNNVCLIKILTKMEYFMGQQDSHHLPSIICLM